MDDTETNIFQALSMNDQVDIMKELRASNLLMKKDIKEEGLIFAAAYSGCENTMKYLLDLEPDALNTTHLRKRSIEDYQLPMCSLMIIAWLNFLYLRR